jgi:hypothetical protein
MTAKDTTIDRRTLMTRILAGGLTAPVMTGSIKAETKGAALRTVQNYYKTRSYGQWPGLRQRRNFEAAARQAWDGK